MLVLIDEVLDEVLITQGESYWYLASPYSKYQLGLDAAFKHACVASAQLVAKGVRLYCPIAHTHPIALYGDIDPRDHVTWLTLDAPFMQQACGLLVADMPGWDESYGIGVEIQSFETQGKPVFHIDWAEQGGGL